MGSIANSENKSSIISNIKEGFPKWFSELEPKIFEDFIQDTVSHDTDDADELPLGQKRINERIKKYISGFLNSDVLLELSEDDRCGGSFIAEFNSLETFSVLGALGFLHCYLKLDSDTTVVKLGDVKNFIRKCEDTKITPENYVAAMKCILQDLNNFHAVQFGRSENIENGYVVDEQSIKIPLLTIKLHFISAIEEDLVQERASLSHHILSEEAEHIEWNLNHYYIKRLLRTNLNASNSEFNLNDEMEFIQKSFAANSKNPNCLLATCKFFTDFISSDASSDLEFAGNKFETHTSLVQFIREASEQITEKYPSFLRAYFAFAEIFANDLPITKQDREYAQSLLEKALKANPDSSKINNKMGLFLMRSRQFSEAKKHFERASQSDPRDYYSLIKLLLRDVTGSNKQSLEMIFNNDFVKINEQLGDENKLPFWKGCYYFRTGYKDLAVGIWVEIILEFYVTKPELDLESVLPFKEIPSAAKTFLWIKSPLTLDAVKLAVKEASTAEKTRRKIVFQRLRDIIDEAIEETSF